MLFYKISAILTNEKWLEENIDQKNKYERARQQAEKISDYNDQNRQEFYIYISNIRGKNITGGIILPFKTEFLKITKSFFKSLGISAKDLDVREITFSSMQNLLNSAARNDFINSSDEVLERFGLDRLSNRYRYLEYGENLINNFTDNETLYEASKRLLCEDTLNIELDRIFSGKKKTNAFGHPVHYFIETDNRETRKSISRTILQALYNNGRINSRRYCFIDFKPGNDFSKLLYDDLYKTCTEGSIIVRYLSGDDSNADNSYASSEMETISSLCETMKKYRNKVLTIFCIPRASENAKKLFYENLSTVGMVEIKEDLADINKATDYLKMLCHESHIRPDKKLYNVLKAENQYLPDELHKIFDEWYNYKMKTSVFPQYKDIQTHCNKTIKKVARGNAYDELQKMVGLNDAKEIISKALNYYKIQRMFKDKGIKQDRMAMHMVFTGNPGTAKTTVARLFARIMKENGLLSKGQLVEVGRGDLVGKYVGWTAQIVKEKFAAAMGGVLFIDEAYSLVDDRGGSFGDEAINTIVQEMENRRENLVVIFAGYPDEMERFLNKNPGLRSRIAFHVPFADYNTKELCEIAKLIGKSKGVTLTDTAIQKLSTVFENARTIEGFGNGRYVRNILEISKMNQANRILSMNPDEITEKTLTSIEYEDIEVPTAIVNPTKHSIGFVAS